MCIRARNEDQSRFHNHGEITHTHFSTIGCGTGTCIYLCLFVMWGATAIFAMLICQYYFQFVNIMISTLLQSIASASFHYRRLWSGMRGRLEVATLFVFVFVKLLTCHSSRRLGQTVPSSGSEPGCRPAGKVSHEFYINLNPESRPGWPRWWPPIIASYTATWRRPSAPPSPPRSSRSPSLSWGSGEDFKNMNALDRYDKLLRSGGLVTKSS